MPKKSGKALAKMTEEERLIYLEQQRLAEEEAKKKKEDLLAQYLKVRSFYFDLYCDYSIELIHAG
jgi:hypothetical protein